MDPDIYEHRHSNQNVDAHANPYRDRYNNPDEHCDAYVDLCPSAVDTYPDVHDCCADAIPNPYADADKHKDANSDADQNTYTHKHCFDQIWQIIPIVEGVCERPTAPAHILMR